MKKKITIIILLFLLTINIKAYSTDRLVDIPVPPNSSGYADFTEEEAMQKQKEYEQSKNTTILKEYLEKSSNNYLKDIRIEGYNLEPKFIRENCNYTIYLKNRQDITSLNISADLDDSNATIEGTGNINIEPNQKSIDIKVRAENGNLKIYKVNLENEENRKKETNINIKTVIRLIIVLILIKIIINLITKRNK